MQKYFILSLTGLLLSSPIQTARAESASRQLEVAKRGAEVMPFCLHKTRHQFTDTENGGIQRVIARDPDDQAQILLIRQHLEQLATNFSVGDYSGPESIHGADMPGLAQLKAVSPDRLNIIYTAVPAGASLTFSSTDSEVIQAVHTWFATQLHDHGHDAVRMQPIQP